MYSILAVLARVHFVRRMESAGGPDRDGTPVGGNHLHAVCRRCGAIPDVECGAGRAPCLELTVAGFITDEAEVTFRGTCARARTRAR